MGLRQKRSDEIDNKRVSFMKPSAYAHCGNLRVAGDKARADILYALYPYDKTIWRTMRRPLWWAILLLRSCPVFGVSSFAFAGVLALIDREDHFQLINFILVYKKFQFWISGVCGLLYISAAYSYCVVIENPRLTRSCGENGPGTFELGALSSSLFTFPVMIGFVFQIILVWIALYLIRFSLPKGGSVHRGQRLVGDQVHWEDRGGNDDHVIGSGSVITGSGYFGHHKRRVCVARVIAYDRKTGLHTVEMLKRSRGIMVPDLEMGNARKVPLHSMRYFVDSERGPLELLLYWDLLCFVAVCVIAVVVLVQGYSEGNLNRGWQWRSALMCLQIGYSLCAMPFFFASLAPWKYGTRFCGKEEVFLYSSEKRPLTACLAYFFPAAVLCSPPKSSPTPRRPGTTFLEPAYPRCIQPSSIGLRKQLLPPRRRKRLCQRRRTRSLATWRSQNASLWVGRRA